MFNFILKLQKTALFPGLIFFYNTSPYSILSQENMYFFPNYCQGEYKYFGIEKEIKIPPVYRERKTQYFKKSVFKSVLDLVI